MQRAPAIKIKVYFMKTTYKHLILNDHHHFNHHQVEVMTINHLSYVKQGFIKKDTK